MGAKGLSVLLLLLAVSSAISAVETEAPVAVSPGHSSHLAQVDSRCPTFNWSSVPGAKAYQLMIYQLIDGDSGEKAKPVAGATVPGSALGWTPALDQCLQRGGRYAWSVRAVGEKESLPWSTPALFQVASVPSAAELDEALTLVLQYLSGQNDRRAQNVGAWVSPSATTAAPVMASSNPAPTRLSVDGNVHAQSFTGDGSHLSGVATAAYDGGNSAVSLTSTPVDVASVTVDQETSGRVVLVSSATVLGDLIEGDAECSIGTSDSSIDSSYRQRVQVPTDGYATIAGTRGYTINKGSPLPPPDTRVYYLVCKEVAGNTYILDANLSAIFVPDPEVFQKPPSLLNE